MGNLFSRFSLVTVSVIAAAVIFGFVAGGVVIHRFQSVSQTSSQQQEQPDKNDQKAGQPEKDDQQGEQSGESHGNGNHKEKSHATGTRTTEPPDSEGND